MYIGRVNFLQIFVVGLAILLQYCSNHHKDKKSTDNVFLFRKHIDKDSTWIDPTLIEKNADCYFVEDAGMNMNHGGWHWSRDLEKSDNDFFSFGVETIGMVKFELDLPKQARAINFDTISKLNYDFINYFYGYARSDSTKDHLSGILTFNRNTENNVTINGTIKVDTENPVTYQEIVFKNYNLTILSLSEAIENEKARGNEIRKQLKKQLE